MAMERLLTTGEVAGLLHCHPQSVYKNESIPLVRIPGVGKRYRQSDLEKYIENKANVSMASMPYLIDNNANALTYYPRKRTLYSDDLQGGSRDMAKAKSKSRFNLGYGAIYQRETKEGRIRWYLDYRNSKGNRIQKLAPLAVTKEHAEIALWKELERERGIASGLPVNQEPQAFEDYAESFKMNYMAVERKNWSSDEYRLGHLIGFFKGKRLGEIEPDSVRRFKKERIDLGNSERTVNRYLALLKKMFNVAITQGQIKDNPVKQVKFYSERETHRSRVLSAGEEIRLLAECPDYLKRIVFLALNTGLRRGEILKLKWGQIDFPRRVIVVENTKGKKARFIPINRVLLEVLQAMRQKDGKGEHVFGMKSIRTAFSNACQRAGIEGLTFHDLRRTFGTRLLERGCDIITIQRLFGHSSSLVTQIYLHPDDRLGREAVDLLAEIPAKKPQKGEEVLHPCDMGSPDSFPIPASDSDSIN
jgi:integrase